MFSFFTTNEANDVLPDVIKKFEYALAKNTEVKKIEHELQMSISTTNSFESSVTLKQSLNSAITKFYESVEILENSFGFSNTSSYVQTDEDLYLLTEKGVYPYDYINCWDTFNETCLPHKEAFYNTLTGTQISDEDYEKAKRVCNHFRIITWASITTCIYNHMFSC